MQVNWTMGKDPRIGFHWKSSTNKNDKEEIETKLKTCDLYHRNDRREARRQAENKLC